MINLVEIKKEFSSIMGIKVDLLTENASSVIICFSFDAVVTINGAEFLLNHNVQLEVPKNYPLDLPIIFEKGKKRIRSFPHLNPDIKETFCLGTEMDIRQLLKPDYSLLKYIQLVAEFLGTYEYYAVYGVFPHGDRGHGIVGIIETYKELFAVATKQQILNLMRIDKLKNRDKNKRCPCNSGKKFKNCHWNLLNTIFRNKLERSQLQKDYKQICGG